VNRKEWNGHIHEVKNDHLEPLSTRRFEENVSFAEVERYTGEAFFVG